MIVRYFKDKIEIRKVKVEATKLLIMAEALSKAKRLDREAEMDYDLDKVAMRNMENSWKDELILLIWLMPVVISFIPEWQPYVVAGFAGLNNIPNWYVYILVGMITVIYGMREIFKLLLQIIGNKIKKDKEPKQ